MAESSQAGHVDINYMYFVHFVRSLPNAAQLKVLDFGCGTGEVVRLLREAGIDCVGCDVFYEAGGPEGSPEAAHLRRMIDAGWIQVIGDSGDLPYPAGSFDVVLANQVFEHVQDMEGTLRRLDRVLRDDGVMCFHFPLQDGWREGHIGIPFAHWFPRGSSWRRRYTMLLRGFGLGYHKDERTVADWTDFQLDWIDRFCHYRTYRQVRGILEPRYQIRNNETEYIRFRARGRPALRLLFGIRGLEPLWSALFRRLGFAALVLRKKDA